MPVRAVIAALVCAAAVTALTGCDPVAWARKSPAERASHTARATASASPFAVHQRCAGEQDAAKSTQRGLKTVQYGSLPNRSRFTHAVAAAGGLGVAVGSTTLEFRDFTPAAGTIDGGVLGPAAVGLIGAGVDRTVLEVAPHTSTRAADVPTTFPLTNQLDVLRVTGAASVLHGFTVRGTAQGHLYNGLRVDRVRRLRATDIRVVGIPGDDQQPPGETFGINDYRTTGSQWSGVLVDGAGIGGSGFGVNGSRDIALCDTVSKDNAAAMGFAFWQTEGIRLVDCQALDNGFSGFNFERVSGSTVLIRPVATGNRYAMRIATDQISGTYTIIDPVLTDGRWTVTLPKRWYGATNKQRRSDITLIIDGKERPDLLRFVTY